MKKSPIKVLQNARKLARLKTKRLSSLLTRRRRKIRLLMKRVILMRATTRRIALMMTSTESRTVSHTEMTNSMLKRILSGGKSIPTPRVRAQEVPKEQKLVVNLLRTTMKVMMTMTMRTMIEQTNLEPQGNEEK